MLFEGQKKVFWLPDIQGRSQNFLKEGAKRTGAQNNPLKIQTAIWLDPMFFGGGPNK